MCRHVGYVGPTIAASRILIDPPHGLRQQSYQPRELLTGTVCADGFGLVWYDEEVRPEPARYASPMPIWSDRNLIDMGPMVRARMMMAAVRNATIAGTTDAANCAPFVTGRHAWSLNGYLEDFPTAWADHVRSEWVSDARRQDVHGVTDGEWLFAAALSRLDEAPEEGLPSAVQSLLRDVLARARDIGKAAQLNVLASDGRHLIASRAGTGPSNSLHHLADGAEFPGGHVVASEPLDEDAWQPVGEQSLLVVQAGAPPVRLQV